MDIKALIKNFTTGHTFSADEISAIRTNRTLRADLVNQFKISRNRSFALALLETFIEMRRDSKNETSIEDLMLASFLLGMHGQVEDCLKVWEAKKVDFDTYCGVDIQLVPFAGTDETIAFLKEQTDSEAKEALEYIVACFKSGDFDQLEEYYSEELPWWI